MTSFTSHIYVVGSKCGPLKVGIASNPAQRLMGLQAGNPQILDFFYLGECAAAAVREIEARAQRTSR